MSDTIKLLPEELNKITDIRKNYFNIQNAIGQIQLSRLNFDKQFENLGKQEEEVLEEYAKTQEAEKEFVQNLQEKYGMGTLDIANGEFVPAPKAPQSKESNTTNS